MEDFSFTKKKKKKSPFIHVGKCSEMFNWFAFGEVDSPRVHTQPEEMLLTGYRLRNAVTQLFYNAGTQTEQRFSAFPIPKPSRWS